MQPQIALPELRIDDFGEYIPGSRKDTAARGYKAKPDTPKKDRKPREHRFTILERRGPDGGIFLVNAKDKLRRPLAQFNSWADARRWKQAVGYERAC